MTIPLAVDIRFHKWDDILASKAPDPDMKTATVFWHFARGMAFAGKGQDQRSRGRVQDRFRSRESHSGRRNLPDAHQQQDERHLKIAENVLGAQIALAKKDNAAAVSMLRDAVAIQDTLKYGEPPDWFYPVRESLGGVLLMTGDAKGAEQVFRDDLDRNPRNPRSLFGLHQALKAQDRSYDAWFRREAIPRIRGRAATVVS